MTQASWITSKKRDSIKTLARMILSKFRSRAFGNARPQLVRDFYSVDLTAFHGHSASEYWTRQTSSSHRRQHSDGSSAWVKPEGSVFPGLWHSYFCDCGELSFVLRRPGRGPDWKRSQAGTVRVDPEVRPLDLAGKSTSWWTEWVLSRLRPKELKRKYFTVMLEHLRLRLHNHQTTDG